MSSAYSTITSNVNLLLIDTKVITKNNPYIAYVSSINIPGRIATIRDATGFLSTPNSIVVSTLKNVLFADGTSSFSITQPFGYITLSARDPNTWNIINTFAFPQPQGVTNVSSIYVNDGIIANSLLVNTYISTNYLNAPSISTINEKASTIFTSSLYANIVSTNILNAVTISTNTIKTSTIFTSTLVLNTAGSNGILSLSNDGKTLLINNIPSGNFTAISTATTNFNMNGFSISNVNTLNTSNISTINISTGTITTSSLRGVNIVSSNATVSNILSGNNINGNNLYGSNSVSGTLVDAYNLNSRNSFNLFDGPNDTFLNPIIGYNNQVLIQNQLLVSNYFTYTAGIINSNYLNNCNNDINFVSSLRFTNINGDIYTPLIQPLYGCNGYLVAGAQTHFLQGIDNCNNYINNVNTITVSNLVINTVVSVPPSLYPTLNPIIGSNDKLMIYNNIDMSNNSINNVFQTSNINDVATNIIIPFYFNMTNIAGANPVNINHNLGWQQVFTNQPTFSFSNNYFRIGGLAPLVKFNFNLRCRLYDNFHDISNGVVAFCYTLSNQTLHVEISGNTFNSNNPIVSFPNFIDPNKYTLSYEDIFNINGATTDTYCFNLYVYPSFQTLNPNYFRTDTHNITFQQVQQVTI